MIRAVPACMSATAEQKSSSARKCKESRRALNETPEVIAFPHLFASCLYTYVIARLGADHIYRQYSRNRNRSKRCGDSQCCGDHHQQSNRTSNQNHKLRVRDVYLRSTPARQLRGASRGPGFPDADHAGSSSGRRDGKRQHQVDSRKSNRSCGGD